MEKPKPKCRLSGQDGNIFMIIGIVKKSLDRNGMRDRASEFAKRATTECKSYDEVLTLCHEYVEVE
jgi:hypothetical protein